MQYNQANGTVENLLATAMDALGKAATEVGGTVNDDGQGMNDAQAQLQKQIQFLAGIVQSTIFQAKALGYGNPV